MQKRGSGGGLLVRKSLKNRWFKFVLKDGWLTYHGSDAKVGGGASHAKLVKSALGGEDGPLELAGSPHH